MKNLLKKWIFAEELAILKTMEVLQKDLEEILKKEELNLIKQKEAFWKEKHEERKKWNENFKKQYEQNIEDFKNILIQEKKTIKDIVDFQLIPGNKVWVFTWNTEGPVQITIKSLIIHKNGFEIRTEGDEIFIMGSYFKTKKEAILAYNKKLEDSKINFNS